MMPSPPDALRGYGPEELVTKKWKQNTKNGIGSGKSAL
jgi:hypothetical protein